MKIAYQILYAVFAIVGSLMAMGIFIVILTNANYPVLGMPAWIFAPLAVILYVTIGIFLGARCNYTLHRHIRTCSVTPVTEACFYCAEKQTLSIINRLGFLSWPGVTAWAIVGKGVLAPIIKVILTLNDKAIRSGNERAERDEAIAEKAKREAEIQKANREAAISARDLRVDSLLAKSGDFLAEIKDKDYSKED
jgi:hypothetical protein